MPGAWPTFYREFAAAVRGEGDPPVLAADAVATARVLDAAACERDDGEHRFPRVTRQGRG